MHHVRFGLALTLLLALAACQPTPTAPAPEPATPRIAVRSVAGVAEFYDRTTGSRFVPRGHNYVKYTLRDDPLLGEAYLDLVLSTLRFDPAEVRRDFRAMRADGFNVVRVMMETCSASGCISPGEGQKLDPAYLDNITTLFEIARDEQMFVWLTSNTLPDIGYYPEYAFNEGQQSDFLTERVVDAYRQYFRDLLQALVARETALEMLFAFSIRNEYWYDLRSWPWSESAGTFSAANGDSYDLSDPSERERLADEGLIHWADEMTRTIKQVVPDALVSIGFFTPNEPNVWAPGDFRLVRTARALQQAEVDLFDFHSSPNPTGMTLEQTVENYGHAGFERKPIVMGEVNAYRPAYPSEALAAQALVDWQSSSCAFGYDGWLTWHWEGDVIENGGFWGGRDPAVAAALSPAAHPDPCATVTVPNPNLAYGAPVTASSELPDEPAGNAVDGTGAQWGSGADAPQWLEVDLGAERAIARLRLTVAQFPAGVSEHRVHGRGESGTERLLHTFRSDTDEGDVLEHAFPAAEAGVRYLRIETVESPSWVSWREVEVYGP